MTMHARRLFGAVFGGVLIALPVASSSSAQELPASSDAPPPTTQPADPPARPPTLDELLGLEQADTGAAEAADDAASDELQRRLEEGPSPRDGVERAVELMRFAAGRLDEEFDTGVGTQRAQREVLARLDELLDMAKQSPQGSSSSSSSSSSSQSQSQSQAQSDPGAQRSGEQQQNAQPGDQRQGDPQQDQPPPDGRREGDLNRVFDESRTEWGSLPERVREMLLQGRQEQFSSLYERLTQEYFRRLAEED